MSGSDDRIRWLLAQPLDVEVAIDGEAVYLRPGVNGAELGVYLWRNANVRQLEEALRLGFSGARAGGAGLALGPDGRGVVLSQWLLQVSCWPQAGAALEKLLSQLALWRAELAPAQRSAPPVAMAGRQEQRMRKLLAGGER